MTNKIPTDKILYAKSLVEDGATIKLAAEQIGVSADHLSLRLRALGVDTTRGKFGRPAHNRLKLNDAEIISRYNSGESVLSISKSLGVSRMTINNRLKDGDIAIRGGSEANFIRMSRTPFEERRRLSKKAREAHLQAMKDRADHYSRGIGEAEICDALIGLGLDARSQTPLGDGVIDITVGNVAIEIKQNTGKCFAFSTKRVKQILDANMVPIFVGFDSADCITERLEEIISLIEFARLHPAPIGEHWVIRCHCYNRVSSTNVYDTTIERRLNNAD